MITVIIYSYWLIRLIYMNQKVTFHTFFIAKVEFISLGKFLVSTEPKSKLPYFVKNRCMQRMLWYCPTIDVRFLFLRHSILLMGGGHRQWTSWAGGIHLGFACLFCYVLLIDFILYPMAQIGFFLFHFWLEPNKRPFNLLSIFLWKAFNCEQ